MTSVLRWCEDAGMQREHQVITEAETGVRRLQTKEHLGSQKLERGKEGLSYKLCREHASANTMISDFKPPEC